MSEMPDALDIESREQLKSDYSELAETTALLEHFVKAYSSAYAVDLKEDTFRILHMDHEFRQVFTMNGSRKDMERFVEEHIHPDDRANMRRMIDSEYIRERLRTESEITFTIREQYGDQERVMRVIIMRGADAEHAAVGFMDVTKELREQKAINSRLEEANRVMMNYRTALLSHALISFTTDLTENRLTDGFWVDDEGKQIELYDAVGLRVPCEYDEYVRRWQDKFVATDSKDKFHDFVDRQKLLATFDNGKTDVTMDYIARTVSGTHKYLRRQIVLTADPATGHIVAYTSVKDITEDKQREEAINLQTGIISRLADRYRDVFLVDAPSRMVRLLRVAGRTTDTAGNDTPYDLLKDRYILEYVHKEEQEQVKTAIAFETVRDRLKEKEKYSLHFRTVGKDDTVHYYFIQASRLGDGDELNRFVIGVACEDEEKQKEEALERAMIEAQNANQAKSAFLFNMSHDIRTPMNAIIGFTDMARKNIGDTARVKDCLEKVKMSGEHLLSLINDVLDMSRVESGKVQIEEKPELLDTCVDHLFSMVNGNAESHQLHVTTVTDPGIRHHWLYMDRLRLMRVLMNIVSNSIKYTRPGGNIRIEMCELPCDMPDRALIRFRVKDTGIGMSSDFLKVLFDPFTRADSSTRSGVTGTGLGMAITRSLVELMGGVIRVESELNRGTEVTVEFPFRLAEEEQVKAQTMARLVREDATALKGKRVLLVEDNELNREISCELLEEEGMQVEAASDGHIAVEMVSRAEPGRYDLILMDIQMPVMNGYEATRAIRALPDPRLSRIPIIAMTANAFEEDKQNAADAGMNGHVAKPIDVPSLIRTISGVLTLKD